MSATPYREVMRTSVQTILPDGSALGTPSYPSRSLAEGQIRSIPMLRFPLSEGEPRVLLELEPGSRQLAVQVGTGQMYSAQPYSDAEFAVVSGEAGRVAVIERPVASGEGDARFRVTMLDAEGDTLWSREYPYQPSAIPAAELDSVRAARTLRATEFATRAGGDRADAEKQVREKLVLPAFRPPLADARISADGSIWLRWTPVPGSPTNRWSLLDEDGEPRASLELPSNLRLVEVQGTTAWAVETGELGVPYVVRLALGPADPS